MRLRVWARVGTGALCGAVSLAFLAASAPAAAAAPKPITGKLSKPGYTVIALTASGRAASVRASKGKFKLRPPARRVTLQLRSPDGTYAGPIVVGGGGDRVIVGVQAGARLGGIAVDVRRGFARVKRRLPKRWRDPSAAARARNGVPIGAGNYGRVRSRTSRASAAAGARSSRDRDLDGVPGALDIDDDGDLLLDNFERSKERARAAQAGEGEEPGAPLYLGTGVDLTLQETVNANAASLTVQDIDDTLKRVGGLQMDMVPGGPVELDCGGAIQRPPRPQGLVYCSKGGIGIGPGGRPFPDCCDPDGDGFGAMGTNSCPLGEDCSEDFGIRHGATTAEIRTGDVLIEHVATDGDSSRCPPPPGTANDACVSYAATLQAVFATVPALVSYSDTAAHSGTVLYPVAPGGLGTSGNGFPVAAGPNGDIVVTLTFWRPQRTRIESDPVPQPGQSDLWTDIGRLTYTDGFGCVPEAPQADKCLRKHCPLSAFSSSDPNLSPTTLPDAQGGLADSASDQPASQANTFSYTLNLTKCARDPQGYGVGGKPVPWGRGEEREFFFTAMNLLDGATQVVYFKRQ